MSINLSIIISHYVPEGFKKDNPIIKTLNIIKEQQSNFNIEVIIADDGSYYSKEIQNNYSKKSQNLDSNRCIYYLEDSKLSKLIDKFNFPTDLISKWVYLPKDKKCMSKAKVVNFATQLSNSQNLLFLDDDNYFISKNSIENLIKLFDSYDFIVGQIKDNNNRKRKYNSNRVQGTTIGLKKYIFNSINGFGEWTEEFSCGIDSDLWIKLYKFYQNQKFNACYTDAISTYDSYSKRWGRYTKFFGDIKLKKKFNNLYGCKNYRSNHYNLSRNKTLWIKNLINE